MFSLFQHYGVLASILAAGVSLAGVAAVWLARERVAAWSGLLAAFAAGLLLTSVLTHLLPGAFSVTAHAPLYALAGYGLLLLIAGMTSSLSGHGDGESWRNSGAALTAWLGISFHSFVDGGIYAVTYEHGLETGLMTMGGLTAHKFIDAVILFSLMILYVTPRRALLWTIAGAVLMTPLGALVTTFWLDTHVLADRAAAFSPATLQPGHAHDHAGALGPLLAAAAGTLLYVSASHLVPHMMERKTRMALPLFALGCAASLALASLLH